MERFGVHLKFLVVQLMIFLSIDIIEMGDIGGSGGEWFSISIFLYE
jgi:hypothetical protein